MIDTYMLCIKYKEEFDKIFSSRPDVKGIGSSKYTNCFWEYAIAKSMNPQFIIESGTWKGQSSWVFRNACPKAEIHCFDISFNNLKWKDESIIYHEHDWWEIVWDCPPRNTLVFFDDHISHEQRLVEAIDRGFKYFLFDDNVPTRDMERFKAPPTPTLSQLLENDSELIRNHVKEMLVLPRLRRKEPNSYLTYVELI